MKSPFEELSIDTSKEAGLGFALFVGGACLPTEDISAFTGPYEKWRATPHICPGFFAYSEIMIRMLQSFGTPTETGDQNDVQHSAFLPYVDVLFVDKRTHEYVRRSSLLKEWKGRCLRNGEFKTWLRRVR